MFTSTFQISFVMKKTEQFPPAVPLFRALNWSSHPMQTIMEIHLVARLWLGWRRWLLFLQGSWFWPLACDVGTSGVRVEMAWDSAIGQVKETRRGQCCLLSKWENDKSFACVSSDYAVLLFEGECLSSWFKSKNEMTVLTLYSELCWSCNIATPCSDSYDKEQK